MNRTEQTVNQLATSPATQPINGDWPTVQPTYLLLADLGHLILAASLMSYLLFFDAPISFIFKLILTAAIAWIMVRGWTWVILSALLANLLLRETRDTNLIVGWGSLLYAWLCLCLVAYAAGYHTLRRQLRYWLGLGLQEMFSAEPEAPLVTPGETQEVTSSNAARHTILFWQLTMSTVARFAGLLGIVVVSMILFGQLPLSRWGVETWWQRSVDKQFQLWPGPTSFLAVIIGLIVINVVSWRSLTRAEAGLYLRTTLMRYYFRDVRSILGRLKKIRRK